MDEAFAYLLSCWIVIASFGAINNMVAQTPDSRILKMCSEKGYLNVKQERITCSVDKK